MRNSFLGSLLLALSLFACSEPEHPRPSWRSLLLGQPPVACTRNADCPSGPCTVEGCEAMATAENAASRATISSALAAELDRCAPACRKTFAAEVEHRLAAGDAGIRSARKAVALLSALPLLSDRSQALKLALGREGDPRAAVRLAALRAAAKLGDPKAQARLAKLLDRPDPALRLLALDPAVPHRAEELCRRARDEDNPAVLQARLLRRACELGHPCSPPNARALATLRRIWACGDQVHP